MVAADGRPALTEVNWNYGRWQLLEICSGELKGRDLSVGNYVRVVGNKESLLVVERN